MRPVLPLSVMVDHDLVDGAPAARFARRLQELIESGAGLLQAEPDRITPIVPAAVERKARLG